MLRHVLVLARDQLSAALDVTIALDRHLSRGEHVEIVQDRRGDAPEEKWPVKKERRRPGALAEQLRTQGYGLVSREDESRMPAYPPVAASASPRPSTVPPPLLPIAPPPLPIAAPPPRVVAAPSPPPIAPPLPVAPPPRPVAAPSPPPLAPPPLPVPAPPPPIAPPPLPVAAAPPPPPIEPPLPPEPTLLWTPIALPPVPGPRIFDRVGERNLAERNVEAPNVAGGNFPRPPVAGAERPRLSLDDREALRSSLNEDWSADPDGRDELARPPRRGGVLPVVVGVAALAVGLIFFSTHARDRLVNALIPESQPTETITPSARATPTDPATSPDSATSPVVAAEPVVAPEPVVATAPGVALPRDATPSPDVAPRAGLPAPEPPRVASPAPERAAPPAPSRAPSSPRLSGATAPSATPTSPPSATAPSATQEAALPEPAARAPSNGLSLPPRRVEVSAAERSQDAALPPIRSQRLAEFPGLPRVEVSRAASADVTTFTVKLTDPRGRPLPDAQVWLRQKSTGGFVRETPLEPISPVGSYRGAVAGGMRREDALSVRVVLGDRRMEMPVSE